MSRRPTKPFQYDPTDKICFGEISINGTMIYYGRAVRSGEWYLAFDRNLDPEMYDGGMRAAREEGEVIIRHPRGYDMLRINWFADNADWPEDWEGGEEFKRILAMTPPPSTN
jgi:hypothetical protein